jgi:uncharacterized short protein YbdD (DUF466 family)
MPPIRNFLVAAHRHLHWFWSRVREWCGDATYERYLRSKAGQNSEHRLDAKEFYLEQLDRRYSRPNRCC